MGIRQTVKRQRQDVIRDLATVFNLPGNNENDSIVPSFEFVKYKYFLDRVGSRDAEAHRDFPVWSWSLAATPLVLALLLASNLVFAFLVSSASGQKYIVTNFWAGREDHNEVWMWAFTAAVGGAEQRIWTDVMLATVLVTSFAVGFLPEPALRSFLRRGRLRNFKQEDEDLYRSFRATPVEVIDGIDTEIRDRLSDYHISSVQNLATANPIMLFVETPYGVYQIMDWVAQAQLCCSVAPRAMIKLWKLGIRTIFDIERACLDDAYSSPQLRQLIGRAIFEDGWAPLATASAASTLHEATPSLDDASIVADVQIRLDDPHVHRLRQIYIRIAERLGAGNRRLPVISTTHQLKAAE